MALVTDTSNEVKNGMVRPQNIHDLEQWYISPRKYHSSRCWLRRIEIMLLVVDESMRYCCISGIHLTSRIQIYE